MNKASELVTQFAEQAKDIKASFAEDCDVSSPIIHEMITESFIAFLIEEQGMDSEDMPAFDDFKEAIVTL